MDEWWKYIAGAAAAGMGALAMLGRDDGAPSPSPAPGGGKGAHPWVGPPVAGLPRGKGIFVRAVSQGGGPSLFADRMGYLGMEWVLLQSMFHDRSGMRIRDASEYPAYAAELQRVGCTPWVWGWPRPESARQFVDVSMEAIEATDAPGLIINVESAYRGRDSADDAARLLELARASLGDRKLGITTYGGGPSWIQSFPWQTFASVDFVVPQFYDAGRKLGEAYPRKAIGRYQRAGYRNIIPAWAASHRYDPEWMQAMADRTPLPAGAACWWDLYWLLLSKERVEWVRSFTIPDPYGSAVA